MRRSWLVILLIVAVVLPTTAVLGYATGNIPWEVTARECVDFEADVVFDVKPNETQVQIIEVTCDSSEPTTVDLFFNPLPVIGGGAMTINPSRITLATNGAPSTVSVVMEAFNDLVPGQYSGHIETDRPSLP